MAFDWNRTGAPPAADEFEVSVVGPGFGECIMIHIGGGRWIIVDSCIDPSTSPQSNVPVAERYLRHLEVPMDTAVELVIATHWHDDHVRGMSRLIQACPAARFSCAAALVGQEFITYVKALETGSGATDGAKVREISQVLRVLRDRNTVIRFANGSKTLVSWTAEQLPTGQPCSVRSLSPSDREYQLFLELLAEMMPQSHQSKKSASRQSPNLASVVLHIDAGAFSLVLGADMEVHHDLGRGWNSVVSEANVSQLPKASFFKVAHHGSVNGHHDQAWEALFLDKPICVATPFNRLPDSRKLPTEADISRLRQLGHLFLTGPRNSKRSGPRDQAVIRGLRESQIVTRELSGDVGMVRFRRRPGETEWRREVFAPAHHIPAES